MPTATQELRIDKRFRDAIRPLTIEERSLLEADIDAHGCTDPILTWANHDDIIIIDGHNRYQICRSLGVPFKTKAMKFETVDDVLAFINRRHRGRRNFTEAELSYLRGREYEKTKGPGHGKKSDHQTDGQTTAEVVAEKHSVSAPTIERDAKFARAVDTIAENAGSKAKHAILSGELDLPKASVQKLAELPPAKQKAAIAGGAEAIKEAITPPKKLSDHPELDLVNRWADESAMLLCRIVNEYGGFKQLAGKEKWTKNERAALRETFTIMSEGFAERAKELE